MEILGLTLWKLRELLKKKEISCYEVVTSLIEKIYEEDRKLHSYLYVNEKAVEEAKKISGSNIQVRHFVISKGAAIEVSAQTVKRSRFLGKLEKNRSNR